VNSAIEKLNKGKLIIRAALIQEGIAVFLKIKALHRKYQFRVAVTCPKEQQNWQYRRIPM